MTIKIAFPNEFNSIQSIAQRTWPETYRNILSREQLEYMLKMMYSLEALNNNYEDGVQFILAQQDDEYYGFGGFEHDYNNERRTHIHKIYVLPEAQGKSVGKMLMHEMERRALEVGSEAITLNVNRNNDARFFYEKLGYEIMQSVDIAIGNGYLMQDFVMRKRL